MNPLMRFVVSFALLSSGAAFAHPPGADGSHEVDFQRVVPAHVRSWTNAKTGKVVYGAFLAARVVDDVTEISIEPENGDVVILPFEDLDPAGRTEAQRRMDEVKMTNQRVDASPRGHVADGQTARPLQAAPFDAFAPLVSTRWDDRWLYVESDGLPHVPGGKVGSYEFLHPMMVGITAWQQQVPLPQNYRGTNAWRIPLKPELADTAVSAKEQLFRGAIALAANGVPIFNPIKNDGRTDTFLAGELDDFGGHCGRADDYHYHIAPLALQKVLGRDKPIAYALDGFPIYGYFDAAAPMGGEKSCPLGGIANLDDLNGHFAAPPPGADPGKHGLYHYHASVTYPYLNGGMRGKVTVKDDQIDPQPRASSPRAALPPLRGATIIGFKEVAAASWSLEYTLAGKRHRVNYRIEDGRYIFDFLDPSGVVRTETYETASARRPPDNGNRPRREPPREGGSRSAVTTKFTLASPDVTDGRLSVDCTCDGDGRAPALTWSSAPQGAKAFAAIMQHVPPDGDTHVYMVVCNIPASMGELTARDTGTVGWGLNTVNRRTEYAPPCSQGPGEKVYTITLYALSAKVEIAVGQALTRDALLAAMKGTTLATATLNVRYARPEDVQRDAGQAQSPDRRARQQDRGGNSGAPAARDRDQRGLLARMTAFKTDVPAHPFNIVLARPTRDSITVSVVCHMQETCEGYIEYRRDDSANLSRCAIQPLPSGKPVMFTLYQLDPNTLYLYRFRHRRVSNSANPGDESAPPPGTGAFASSEYYKFHTPRAPGGPGSFAFTVQADSHLDQGVDPAVYERTLANMLAGNPDFMIDLGDTFMTDKRGQDFRSALAQYDAQRYYFSRAAHSVPLFMALGNHDGETGTSGRSEDNIGPWSYHQRTTRFPEPRIDGRMYTGATAIRDGVGSNYYAFEWGDALFIILDPFWSTTERIRGGAGGREPGAGTGERNAEGARLGDEPLAPSDSSWTSTLGRTQYDWLADTLATTTAKYRFVFIHHLVGGLGGSQSRGGVESSGFYEWGGKNADGSPGFAEHRPEWPMPIHELLVKHNVAAVFHGHDHLYVRSERDGVVYQCVPQPGNPRGNTRSSAQYGYVSGTVLGSPGHLRVRVEPEKAVVEFIRSTLADGVKEDVENEPNGAVVHAYEIAPVGTKPASKIEMSP